jgi:hypothetical protein
MKLGLQLNSFDWKGGPRQCASNLAEIGAAADEAGTDYQSIEKTCAFRFDVGENGEKAEELLGQLRWLAGMGIETVIGLVPGVDRISPLEIIGERIIPAVANV